MGAFQRLTEGRPWGGYRSPWLCWACRPCWAWWWTPSIMSTMATQLKSCRSSLRTRRQAWSLKRWFMTELTATAGFRRLHFHRLPVPLRHRLTQGLQQQQQQSQQQPPQLRILPQNIHHRLPPPHHHLHPQQQRQQQQAPVKQRAQEEAQRQTQRPLQEREEEQAQQTMQQQHQFSGWRQ